MISAAVKASTLVNRLHKSPVKSVQNQVRPVQGPRATEVGLQ